MGFIDGLRVISVGDFVGLVEGLEVVGAFVGWSVLTVGLVVGLKDPSP